jgi:hypothetical protein
MYRGDRGIIINGAVVASVLGATNWPHAKAKQRHLNSRTAQWSILHMALR